MKKLLSWLLMEMDVTDPEQKEELAQSLIREWECPAWLETEAGVSVKVALNLSLIHI